LTRLLVLALAPIACASLCSAAQAHEMVYGGKLLLTRGVTQVEGAGGGGLAAWSLVTGNETEDGVGASAFATDVRLPDYELRDYGAAIGLFDQFEFSYAHQDFDTGGTGALLGLGAGFTFSQDIFGAKVRVLGDAVYDQNSWLPQIAVGLQYKHNNQNAIIHAIGGRGDDGVDYYVAATKILLDQSLVLSGAARVTKANQFGILGFGGDRNNDYKAEFEGSAAYMVSDRLVLGAEYRTKPDNLGFAREDDASDVFAAFAVTHNLSITAAYADLGDIATLKDQHGFYLSLQAGF